jgi:type II secretory pathway component PulC
MSNRLQIYAVGAASASVLVSLLAVGVVASRSAKGPEGGPVTLEATVSATDVVKLKREVVETMGNGVRLKDEKLNAALGLQPNDVVTMIGGHPIKRERDVFEAMLAASMLEVAMLDVDVTRDGHALLMRWKIDGDLKAAVRLHDSTSTPGSFGGYPVPRPALPDPVDPLSSYGGSLTARDPALDTIKKIDDNHYEIPKSTIDRVLANPMDFAKGARVVPAMKNGAAVGFKLYAIRPNSVWGSLGFMNGDTLKSINGFEMTSADKALEVYTKLRDATSLEVEIERRGSPVTLKYDIK